MDNEKEIEKKGYKEIENSKEYAPRQKILVLRDIFYENADEEIKAARNLPKATESEKEIRSDAIKNARTKKESASLIRKYGIDNIVKPDESVKEELQNRETNGFVETIKVRRELKAYLKAVSVYERAVKPYTDAKNLIEQAENYTHYEELEARYAEMSAQ